jgi:hypothetical protein
MDEEEQQAAQSPAQIPAVETRDLISIVCPEFFDLGRAWAEAMTTAVRADHRYSFAELLRRYRLTAGLTQEELAEKAELSVLACGIWSVGCVSRTGTRCGV